MLLLYLERIKKATDMKHFLIVLLLSSLFISCSSDDENPFIGTWELLDTTPVERYTFNTDNRYTRCRIISDTQVNCGQPEGYQYTKDTFTANLTGVRDTYTYEILTKKGASPTLTLKSSTDPSVILTMVKKK